MRSYARPGCGFRTSPERDTATIPRRFAGRPDANRNAPRAVVASPLRAQNQRRGLPDANQGRRRPARSLSGNIGAGGTHGPTCTWGIYPEPRALANPMLGTGQAIWAHWPERKHAYGPHWPVPAGTGVLSARSAAGWPGPAIAIRGPETGTPPGLPW